MRVISRFLECILNKGDNMRSFKRNNNKNVDYDKYYRKYDEIFKEHIGDRQNYTYYNKLYGEIRFEYKRLIKEGSMNINVERSRLESKIGKSSENSLSISSGFIIFAISIFASGVIQAISLSNYENKATFILVITITFYISTLAFVTTNFGKKNEKDFVFNICLRVLEDIEKQVEQEKFMEIESRKALEEVAATRISSSGLRNVFNKIIRFLSL